jgi:hypothetical protein
LPNSKFVCGVKGNHREIRDLSVIESKLQIHFNIGLSC